jgi:uracil-DNA glycosylase
MIKGKKTDKKSISSNSKRVFRILPDFKANCRNCSLANNQAIGGHSFGPLNEVELIIVAAYPATEEVKKGYTLASNEKKPNIDRPNAGRYIEYSMLFHFDWDELVPQELKPFYNKVAFTNMIKCSPFSRTGDKLDVKDTHIKSCKRTWLEKEIAEIGKYNPTCPILLCGSEAAKLLAPKQTVYSSRRQEFTYNNTHPVVITFNPVEVVRYTAYEIIDSKINLNKKLLINSIKPEKPVIVGSTTWHWKQDMELIKKLVLRNYENRMKNK